VTRVGWMVGTFFVMYLVATIMGFATYLLLTQLVMWISVFTIMPVVSALLIYTYLRKLKISQEASLRESLLVAAAWILLSFGLDSVVYIAIIPFFSHVPPNWTFFRDQSPWIWMSYAILLLSALVARNVYRRNANA
jgi:hypothetical protein